MKVTVLVENTALEGLLCEHGLSLLIEHKDKKYLLDAGQSKMFMLNASKLNADIAGVEYAILSHGHYDHSGGFFEYIKENKVKVHAMNSAFGDYYSSKGGMHEISVPKEIKETHTDAFEFHNKVTELSEGIYFVSFFHKKTCFFSYKIKPLCRMWN